MFGKRRTPGLGGGQAGASGAGRGGPLGRSRSLQDTRRALEPPSRSARQGDPRGDIRGDRGTEPPVQSAAEGRTLVVGQGIRLSGEIKRCETLVVEGEVEANLTDCLSLEINDSGLFKGSAVVEQAEISGRLEGELTVKGRLFVRASGHLQGTIRYADLEIERGGRIAGSVDVIEPPAVKEPVKEPAAEIAEVADESEPAADRNDAPEEKKAPAGTGNGKAAPKASKEQDEAASGAII